MNPVPVKAFKSSDFTSFLTNQGIEISELPRVVTSNSFRAVYEHFFSFVQESFSRLPSDRGLSQLMAVFEAISVEMVRRNSPVASFHRAGSIPTAPVKKRGGVYP